MYSDLSDDQLISSIRQRYYPDIPIQEFVKRVEYAPMDVTNDMSGLEKFGAGIGKAFSDVGTGAQQLAAGVADFVKPRRQNLSGLVTGKGPTSRVDELRAEVAQTRNRDAALMDTGAGFAGNLAGNLAMFAPTAMIPGANTVTGGALTGAALSALQPSASGGETAGNMLFGAVAGGAVPAVSRAWQTGRAMAEPFHEAGQNAIVGRALNRAAGNDAAAVAQRLREASQPFVGPSQGLPRTVMGEYVPGSVPTVGQAAGNPGMASLERAATAINPEVTNAVSNLMRNQNAARVGVLDDMAGSSGARDFFASARDATANQLYENAYQRGIDITRNPVTQQFKSKAQISGVKGEITKLMQRPAIQDAVKEARRLAANEGVSMKDMTGSVKGLDYVKRALDDQINKAVGNERRILVDLKSRLLTTIDGLSPDYQAARQTFAGMSRPINQMDVAQEIADKSVNRLTGNLQPQAFARAFSDESVARATGLPSATLANTMSPAQLNAMQSIMLDVQRANAAQTMGRGVGSDTVQKLAYSNILDQAGVPTFLREFAPAQIIGNLGARASDIAYGRANRELGNRMAEIMLDPAAAANAMAGASRPSSNLMLRLMERPALGMALSAPALTNAQKQ